MWHCYSMQPLPQVSFWNFCPKCCYWHLEAATPHPPSGRSCKLTDWGCPVLKHVAYKNCLSSVASLIKEFQTACGSSISSRPICGELHKISLHGWAAAHKPKFTMSTAKWASWNGLKHSTTGLWTNGNVLSGMMNRASLSSSLPFLNVKMLTAVIYKLVNKM